MITDNVRPIAEARPSPDHTKNPGGLPTLIPGLWPVTPHAPDTGINSMADAAARLFSLAGKLAQLKFCTDPATLQKELITELGLFQEFARTLYTPEQVFVGRYALCATLDDIISHLPWGSSGQWQPYSLLALFSQEPIREEGFFIILERLVRDPALYIDLLEFMYLCLSLGFRGTSNATGFTNSRLDQIRDALYRHIRVQKGDVNRALSPWPVKVTQTAAAPPPKKNLTGLVFLLSTSTALLLFASFSYWIKTSSEDVHHGLAQLENIQPASKPALAETFNA